MKGGEIPEWSIKRVKAPQGKSMTIGSPLLWLPACVRARHCIVVLFPKVGKCDQTNNIYTFKQSKILQISFQLH